MIEEIYQPHYDHFSEYFGNTFVGFFSDEPRFGNGKAYDCQTETVWTKRGLGILGMAYPWSDEIISVLGIQDMRVLVSLWNNLEIPECAQFREKYMHYLTDKFAENFSGMIGKWCEEHGVMYSGHIIEDEGAHAITCCSAGHYFKATIGQSISGIDVVYNQVDLDFIDETHANGLALPYVNGTFSNFALAKLASSAAHLDKKKEGRALCEIFGAFGWGESIAKMKKLVDFMLVRGINHFIPHAFNPFIEDEDSPPYFYCGGLNPQYDSFKTLSAYMLEMSELFNGGKTDIRVAVLYHAEAVWSGYEYMDMEDVCKYLAQRQIDYDIVPEYEIRAIAQIMTDLKEFENNHNDLIRQCVLQGSRIYEGLLQMASSSRVTIYDGKDKKQMIRFDIPAEVDTVVASAAIADEIDKGTKELVARMTDEAVAEVDIKKMAEKTVGSRNLLRKYIGKEAIRVDAYKIDQNPQNAGYRSWGQTQVNNSGAEKFVVYFAVILSLMNYTRGDFGSIRDKDLRSALILDNPFGATSSKHILVPMFAIAKHFRVQMICLSDINKSDVINCFDIVIKAIVKKRPMSNNELLTHEGNESIEHGFYRLEQLSLL